MLNAERQLDDLKNKMTPRQIKDMQEIIQAEVNRREKMKNVTNHKSLSSQRMAEVYSEIDDKIKELRTSKLETRKGLGNNLGSYLPKVNLKKFRINHSAKNTFLVLAVLVFAFAKVLSLSFYEKTDEKIITKELIPATENTQNIVSEQRVNQVAREDKDTFNVSSNLTAGEKQLLTELDSRRVELDKRAELIEQKEIELKNQSQAINEKLAELRSLTTKLQQVRLEKDNQYEARLEQLAQVYSSIPPNEVAPLMAKLNDDTALALLKRMPGKRMGQILSQMDPDRAVELTKVLTSKDKLDEVPAR